MTPQIQLLPEQLRPIILTSSRIGTFIGCRKRYEYQFVDGIVHKQPAPAPAIGSLVHKLLEYYDRGEYTEELIKTGVDEIAFKMFPEADEALRFDLATQAARLVHGYVMEHRRQNYKVMSHEPVIEHLYKPNLTLRCKLDVLLVDDNEGLWIQERKTTSKMDNFYLKGLKQSLQLCMQYYLVLTTLRKPKGFILDLIVKTTTPQYKKVPMLMKPKTLQWFFALVAGVEHDMREIYAGRSTFFPSLQCIQFFRECEYYNLCHIEDSPAVREQFYTKHQDPYFQPEAQIQPKE